MVVGKGSDLRQVGDAEHLLGPRKLLQLLAHGFGSAPSDAAVNLVENQGPLDRASAAAVAPTSRTHPLPRNGREGWGTPILSCFNRRLQRQHHARKLAAGSDLLDRPERLSGIGGDEVLNLIEAARAPVPFLV